MNSDKVKEKDAVLAEANLNRAKNRRLRPSRVPGLTSMTGHALIRQFEPPRA